jgi:hypothetical protein
MTNKLKTILTSAAETQHLDVARFLSTLEAHKARRSRQRRVVGGAALLVATAGLVVTGVMVSRDHTDETTVARDPASSTRNPRQPALVVASTTLDGYPAALLTGKLRIVNDCAYLGDWAVVFPPGTVWGEDNQTIRLPSGVMLSLDERSSLAGGLLPVDQNLSDIVGEAAATEAEQCSGGTPDSQVVLAAP